MEELTNIAVWKENVGFYIIICICVSVFVIVILDACLKNRKWKKQVPLYKFYIVADIILLLLFSVLAGLITEPVKEQILVFIILFFVTGLIVWGSKRHCKMCYGLGYFYFISSKPSKEIFDEAKRLTDRQIEENTRLGEEELKKWKPPFYYFLIPAYLPLIVIDLLTLWIQSS